MEAENRILELESDLASANQVLMIVKQGYLYIMQNNMVGGEGTKNEDVKT